MDIQIDADDILLDAPPTPPASVAASSAQKNAHLKGRKRFAADFADLKAQGLELGGLALSEIRTGDDEGMIDLVVVDRANGDKRVVGCNLRAAPKDDDSAVRLRCAIYEIEVWAHRRHAARARAGEQRLRDAGENAAVSTRKREECECGGPPNAFEAGARLAWPSRRAEDYDTIRMRGRSGTARKAIAPFSLIFFSPPLSLTYGAFVARTSFWEVRADEDVVSASGTRDEGLWECGSRAWRVRNLWVAGDTSEYPAHHTILTYTDDDDPPPTVTKALSALESGSPLSIAEALERFLLALSGGTAPNASAKTKPLAAVNAKSQTTVIDSDDEAEDDDEDYDAYFPNDDFGSQPFSASAHSAHGTSSAQAKVLARLQRDFFEIVSSKYTPGLIPFSVDSGNAKDGFDVTKGDFALSISLPTVSLTSSVPAQALVAWDRRLLNSPTARHLVLLISGFSTGAGDVRAALDATAVPGGGCKRYKPGREAAMEAGRTFGLVGRDAEDEVREERERREREREASLFGGEYYGDADADGNGVGEGGSAFYGGFGEGEKQEEMEAEGSDDRFERFALSSALEALMDAQLVKLIALRRAYGVGWAGAEAMYARCEGEQKSVGEVWEWYRQEILAADAEEATLARAGPWGVALPHDPLRALPKGEEINLPYTAFCYLVRRLTLCTRYCLGCHNKLTAEFEAIKPYVCDRPLCMYQYYAHNRRVSLEYEIIYNPATVDLLVSLAYCAAAEGVIDEPLPKGMALRVPPPDKTRITTAPVNNYHRHNTNMQPVAVPAVDYQVGLDGLVEFDQLPVEHIDDMRRHLERKVKPGKSKPRLKEMENGTILPAAWLILRWCVASCTAYLEETSEEQQIQGVDSAWRQFRFSIGAPDAEAKFQKVLQTAIKSDSDAEKYQSLFAFHGSALRNWHSIIRHGLWYKTVANGRAFGDGVYLAKEAQTSMGHYATDGQACWQKSKLRPTSCVALAEVVNLPHKFVSSKPHFVVKDTEWIMCRYLLVKGLEAPLANPSAKAKTLRRQSCFILFYFLFSFSFSFYFRWAWGIWQK
ncbi:hypothetical protein B0H19DRAFT_1383300 [Mycena capillaripes]|nr:hypothetical protein B0H19DRAFT_1383300 [Mycena capillaripes]